MFLHGIPAVLKIHADATGSKDKKLKIFTGEDDGTAHCQFDNHLPALLYVSDWLAKQL